MYKVLLVDDETWALEGIRNTFRWNDMGYEVIGALNDSVEALDFIDRENPDVVFTDIRMPEVSGIDLIKKVREKGNDVEFIIVSGYAEFDYAREALKAGAFDYILKPLEEEETDVILKKLYQHLEEKRINHDMIVFEALMESRINTKELFSSLNFKPQNIKYLAVMTMCSEEYAKEIECLPPLINALKLKLGLDRYLYIINDDGKSCDFIEQLRNLMRQSLNINIGVSNTNASEDCLSRLVREADCAYHNRFIYAKNDIYIYKKNKIDLLKKLVEKISLLIVECGYEELSSTINDIPVFFNNQNLGIEEAVFVWNQVVVMAVNRFGDEAVNLGMEFMDYQQIINRFGSLTMLCKYLDDCLNTLLPASCIQIAERDVNENFRNLIDYVDRHISQNLQLRELSEKFFLNYTYCSSLFKKTTGYTFSEYINDLRIRKASDLLEKSSLSIYDICMETGYKDYYYFNKVFKRLMGVTPSQYRKSRRLL